MPLDYSFEHTPSFRDLTQTGLLLLSRPLVRSLGQLRRLRRGELVIQVPIAVKTARTGRRATLPTAR